MYLIISVSLDRNLLDLETLETSQKVLSCQLRWHLIFISFLEMKTYFNILQIYKVNMSWVYVQHWQLRVSCIHSNHQLFSQAIAGGLLWPRRVQRFLGRIALFGGFGEWWLHDHETLIEMWTFLRGAPFALKAAVFFSVSSLELAPVVSVQPSTYPYWELKWLLLRNEMPSPATMSCISGHSPYMIYEVWVPRSSMASSVLELLTISVSKTSSPIGSHPYPYPLVQ